MTSQTAVLDALVSVVPPVLRTTYVNDAPTAAPRIGAEVASYFGVRLTPRAVVARAASAAVLRHQEGGQVASTPPEVGIGADGRWQGHLVLLSDRMAALVDLAAYRMERDGLPVVPGWAQCPALWADREAVLPLRDGGVVIYTLSDDRSWRDDRDWRWNAVGRAVAAEAIRGVSVLLTGDAERAEHERQRATALWS